MPVEPPAASPTTANDVDPRHVTHLDVVAAGLVAVLACGYLPGFIEAVRVARYGVLLGVLPLGALLLVRLVRWRDAAAAWLMGLLVTAVVAGLLAEAPAIALVGAFDRNTSALQLLGAASAWAIGRAAGPAGRRLIELAFFGGIAVNLVAATIQIVVQPTRSYFRLQGGRISGLETNSVFFAAMVAGAAALAVWTMAVRREEIRLAIVAVASLAAGLAGSRVALASLAVVVVAALVVGRDLRAVRSSIAFAAGAVAAVPVHEWLVGRERSALQRGAFGEGGSVRLDLWEAGLRAFADAPLLGHGLGRYRMASQRYFEPDFVGSVAYDDVIARWFDAHNIVVELAVGVGLIGLVAALGFVWQSLRHARSALAWACVAMVGPWMLQPVGPTNLALVAVLLGAAHAAGTQAAASPTSDPAASWSRLRRDEPDAPATVPLLLALGGLLLGGYLVIASYWVTAGVEHDDANALRRASDMLPYDPVPAGYYADRLLADGQFDAVTLDAAVAASREVTEREPDFPLWWARLATRELLVDDVDGARRSLDRLLDLQPYHLLGLQLLENVAERQGDPAAAALARDRLAEIGGSP